MILKRTLKYPVLIIGVVLFYFYITDPKTKSFWENYNNRVPSTCRVTKDRVTPKAPDNWELECLDSQYLVLTIEFNENPKTSQLLRSLLYKELANSLRKFASLTNQETLEFLKNVKVKLVHPSLEVIAKTDGEALVQLLQKKGQKSIAKHLRLTVKTKEIKK